MEAVKNLDEALPLTIDQNDRATIQVCTARLRALLQSHGVFIGSPNPETEASKAEYDLRHQLLAADQKTADARKQIQALELELQSIRNEVSRFLIAHRSTAKCWVEAFVECGAIEADFNYHPLYPFIKPKGGAS